MKLKKLLKKVPKDDRYIAYTLDNCRGGYIITAEDLEKLKEMQNDTQT